MSRLVFDVAYDLELQVSRSDSGFLECYIFCDGVILTITRSTAQALKRRRPVVFNAVLGQITHRPNAQVDRAIDLAQQGATLAFPTLFDDRQKTPRSRRTGAIARTACRERRFVGANAGLKIRPLRRRCA